MSKSDGAPVMFSITGMATSPDGNNEGFDSPTGESKPAPVTAYTIPPVIWMIIFLVGGYLGLRYIMED